MVPSLRVAASTLIPARRRPPVRNSDVPVVWPVLGLALQKNYISLYNSANGAGEPFTCTYAGRLGRARVSKKGAVSFSTLRDVDLQVLAEMIGAIDFGLASGELVTS